MKVERYEWRWKVVCLIGDIGMAMVRIGYWINARAWKMVRWTAKP